MMLKPSSPGLISLMKMNYDSFSFGDSGSDGGVLGLERFGATVRQPSAVSVSEAGPSSDSLFGSLIDSLLPGFGLITSLEGKS